MASWPCTPSCPHSPSQGLERIPMCKEMRAVRRQGQVSGFPPSPPQVSGFQSQELDPGKFSRVLRQADAHPSLRGQQRSTGDMNRTSWPLPCSPGV